MRSEDSVFILSKDDKTSDQVAAYIASSGLKFIKADKEKCERQYPVSLLLQNLKTAKGIWLWSDDFSDFRSKSLKTKDISREKRMLNEYIHFIAEHHKKCLGSLMKEFYHNRLIDIEKAKSLELKAPMTFIISKKAELSEILHIHPDKTFITKAMWNHNTFLIDDKKYAGGFPQTININDLNKIEVEHFFPSLIQEYIEKEFELRIFYLNGDFYTMAIFSQRDEQTKFDFRNYNRAKPNRNVPFTLPGIIKEKLNSFMHALQLNTGSIDMIYSKTGEFVFLEVNPVGQFGWVSENCNYYIERKIAHYLSN